MITWKIWRGKIIRGKDLLPSKAGSSAGKSPSCGDKIGYGIGSIAEEETGSYTFRAVLKRFHV